MGFSALATCQILSILNNSPHNVHDGRLHRKNVKGTTTAKGMGLSMQCMRCFLLAVSLGVWTLFD